MKVYDECALPENVVPLREEPKNSDPQNTQEHYDEHDLHYSPEAAAYFMDAENFSEVQKMSKDLSNKNGASITAAENSAEVQHNSKHGTFFGGTEAGVTPGVSPPAINTEQKLAEAQNISRNDTSNINSGTQDVNPTGKDTETDVSSQKGHYLQPIQDGNTHATFPVTYDDIPHSAPPSPPPRVIEDGVSHGNGLGDVSTHGTLVNAEATSTTVKERPSGKEEIQKTASRKGILKPHYLKQIEIKDSESLSTIQEGDNDETIILGTRGLGIGSLYFRITTPGHTRSPEINLVLVPYLRGPREPRVILKSSCFSLKYLLLGRISLYRRPHTIIRRLKEQWVHLFRSKIYTQYLRLLSVTKPLLR